MKILLVCSAGMSTSLLVTKMEQAAKARGIEIEILAHAANEAKKQLDKADIILLGPQVRFMKDEFSKAASVPVQVIDMRSYGRMDGAAVLSAAIKELGIE
ncbi:MAG: PTS sugar transporter subunit IIB [Firmicutes bacterium]|nr:PTS sugar transporter subunit IIB [Bacillota bacterium]